MVVAAGCSEAAVQEWVVIEWCYSKPDLLMAPFGVIGWNWCGIRVWWFSGRLGVVMWAVAAGDGGPLKLD